MFGGFGGGFVAEGAGFELGEDCLSSVYPHCIFRGIEVVLLRRSMAHCSNSSSVMSAVGGVS